MTYPLSLVADTGATIISLRKGSKTMREILLGDMAYYMEAISYLHSTTEGGRDR